MLVLSLRLFLPILRDRVRTRLYVIFGTIPMWRMLKVLVDQGVKIMAQSEVRRFHTNMRSSRHLKVSRIHEAPYVYRVHTVGTYDTIVFTACRSRALLLFVQKKKNGEHSHIRG